MLCVCEAMVIVCCIYSVTHSLFAALKEVSQSAEPADRVPALLRSLAFLVGPALGIFSAFEAILSAQIAGLTGAAANQLTAVRRLACVYVCAISSTLVTPLIFSL